MTVEIENEGLGGRELILKVALELFIESGFDGVSMQQIATAANMTKGSPYYHFKGKEDLFIQAFLRHIQLTNQQFMDHMNADVPFRDRLVATFAYALESVHPGLFRLIDDVQRLSDRELCELIPPDLAPPDVMRKVYAQAFADAGMRFRLEPLQIADALMAMQSGALHNRLMMERGLAATQQSGDVQPEPAEVLAERMIDLLFHGVLADGD